MKTGPTPVGPIITQNLDTSKISKRLKPIPKFFWEVESPVNIPTLIIEEGKVWQLLFLENLIMLNTIRLYYINII